MLYFDHLFAAVQIKYRDIAEEEHLAPRPLPSSQSLTLIICAFSYFDMQSTCKIISAVAPATKR